MNYKLILAFILSLDALILLLQIDSLSISYYETLILYDETSLLHYIIQSSIFVFGQNDYALRIPMIALHIASALLLFSISKEYLKHARERLWLVTIFVLLPGSLSSAIVVNSAGLLIFGLFLFVYLYERVSSNALYILLAFYTLVDGSFIYLFLALGIYAIYEKKKELFMLSMSLFFISIYLYGVDASGIASGYFLESMAIYGAIFTPIIFIYLVYTLYRKYLTKNIDLLWFISVVGFIISLILSFRQKVELANFAPYLMLALPLAAQTFYHSYRVRLRVFRGNYRMIFIVSLVLLVANTLLMLFNKELYAYIKKPQKHFTYKMHIAKELSQKLKDEDIRCVNTGKKIAKRLKFYGIDSCTKHNLTKKASIVKLSKKVTVSYKNRVAYTAYVTEINTY